MKVQRSSSPALWFLFGALVASEPWAWLLTPPAGLAPQLVHSSGAVWRAAFLATSFAGFLGYATGIALFRSVPSRTLGVAIGAGVGLAIVAATRLPLFAGADFGPLALAAVSVGLLVSATAPIEPFRDRRNGASRRSA